MEWVVLFDEEFDVWFLAQEQGLQDEILANVELLRQRGPNLGRPRVDTIKEPSISNMKELIVQYRGDPWRIFFAFDPRRSAILLVGGNKRGKKEKRWYREHIRIADDRYNRHLQRLKREEGD